MILTTLFKYNLIHTNTININLYGESIENVEHYKYLGFIGILKKQFQYIYNKI